MNLPRPPLWLWLRVALFALALGAWRRTLLVVLGLWTLGDLLVLALRRRT